MKRKENRQDKKVVILILITAAVNLVAALIKLIQSLIEKLPQVGKAQALFPSILPHPFLWRNV